MLSLLRTLSIVIAAVAVCALLNPARADVVAYDNEVDWQALTDEITLVDFDAVAGIVTGQYPGVDFQPFNSGTPRTHTTAWAASAPNVMRTRGFGHGGGGWAVDLSSPAMTAGFWIFGLQYPNTTVELLDEEGDSLGVYDAGAVAVGEGALKWAFVGLASSEGNIARVQVSVNAADFVLFDDVQFGVAPLDVPEPAALALMGLGGLGLLLRRRRRQ